MALQNPLVLANGRISQLPPGGTISGYTLGNLVAGSGLVGGGDLSTGNKQIDVALAANPSGLIYVGDTIGYDGAALASANNALASGNAALSLYPTASASGTAAQNYANTALTSGNTALQAAVNAALFSNAVSFPAGASITAGAPVGTDEAGKVVPIYANSSGNWELPSFGIFSTLHNSLSAVSYNDCVYDSFSNRVYNLVGRTGTAASTTHAFVYQSEIIGNSISFTNSSGIVTSGAADYPVLAAAPNIRALGAFYDDIKVGVIKFNFAVYSGGDYRWYTDQTGSLDYTMGGPVSSYNQIKYLDKHNAFVLAYASGNAFGHTIPVKIVEGVPVRGTTSGFSNNVTALGMTYNKVDDYVLYTYAYSTTNLRSNIAQLSGDVMVVGNESVVSTDRTYTAAGLGFTPCAHLEKANRFIAAWARNTTPRHASYALGVISGTASGAVCAWYPEVQLNTGNSDSVEVVTDNVNDKVIFAYRDVANSSYGTARVGTLSGTGEFLTLGTEVVFRSVNTTNIKGAYDSLHNNVTLNYFNTTNSRVECIVFDHLGVYNYYPVTSGNFSYLGIAQSAVSSGSNVTVLLPKSVDYNQSGLSVGTDYYLDVYSGGLTTASGVPPTWSGGASNWAPVGRALNSSGLYLTSAI